MPSRPSECPVEGLGGQGALCALGHLRSWALSVYFSRGLCRWHPGWQPQSLAAHCRAPGLPEKSQSDQPWGALADTREGPFWGAVPKLGWRVTTPLQVVSPRRLPGALTTEHSLKKAVPRPLGPRAGLLRSRPPRSCKPTPVPLVTDAPRQGQPDPTAASPAAPMACVQRASIPFP